MEKAPYPFVGLPPLLPEPAPLIYISGPLTSSGSVAHNIRRSLEVAELIRMNGGLPFVPHLFFFWETSSPMSTKTAEFFLDMDREYIRRAAAFYRLAGPSFGATLEEGWAREFGVPVYKEEDGGLNILLDALRLGAYR